MKRDIIYNIMAIVVCIMCITFQSKQKAQHIRAVQVQNVFWLTGFIVYLFNIVPYYSINGEVYVSAMLYLIGFNAVFLINPIKKKQTKFNEIAIDCDKQEKKCILASILCWVVSIPILHKTIPILIMYGPSQGMNALRYRTYGEHTIFSTPELMLIDYIIRPILLSTILLMAGEVAQKKCSIRMVIISVLDAFWLILATAGRSLLVSLVIYVLLGIVLLNGSNIFNIISRYKKYIIPCAVLSIVILQIITKRINRDNSFVKEGAIYYFSGLPFLSTMIEQDKVQSSVLFGKATLSFVYDLPVVFLRIMGIVSANTITAQQYLSGTANDALFVGDNIQTNATASTLFAFYSDFGLIGSLIGGFFLGVFANYIEKNFEKKYNCLNLGRYIFLLSLSMATTQNYPLTGIPFLMKWIFIYLLLK